MSELSRTIKNLLALQEVDTHIAVLLQEQEEAPKRVARLEAEAAARKLAVGQAEAELQELEAKGQDLGRKIEDSERKSKRSQSRMNEVKNPRQHMAVLKELEDLKTSREEWEGQMLEVMEALEAVKGRLAQARTELALAEDALTAEQAALKAHGENLAQQVAKLKAERKEYLGAVPRDVLDQYDFIRSRLRDAAVAPVMSGICQACHMSLTPQAYNELRRLHSLMSCPHCHRIIYWGEYEGN